MIRAIIFDWIGTLYERNKDLYPFSERVLKTLKPKYKLGLVTLAGKGIKAREKDLEKTGVKHYFDSIIIDTDKSEKQYLQCIQELGTTPDTTAIIDDQMRRLIIGIKLNCKTYWIQTGEFASFPPNSKTGEPTKRIDSIKDLVQLQP